jgi:hypothetical protein
MAEITSKAHALGTHSAAISTPPENDECLPMLVIFNHGQSLNLCGVEALEALGEVIQHALGVSDD